MKTAFLLMAQHGSAMIPLASICDEYLGMTQQVAQRKAATQELPFPVVRLNPGRKSPLVVHVDDLAAYIDKQRAEASTVWQQMQSAIKGAPAPQAA